MRLYVRANDIVVHLKQIEMIAIWRSAGPEARSQTDRQILNGQQELLESGETLVVENDYLILSLPVRARFRGGAATVSDPAGKTRRADLPLIKALARAHQWRKMLLSGEAASIDALAQRFNLDRGHVGLTLNLASLSPTLARAVIRGEQPPGLSLNRLLRGEIPLSWRDQEAAFLSSSAGCK
jgi:hypothetical protein